MKPFEVGKTYKTKHGSSVRVIAIDAKGNQPIIGLLEGNDHESVQSWGSDGSYFRDKTYCDTDLIPEKEPRTVWLNVYPLNAFNRCVGYPDRRDADVSAAGNRIACIPVTFEIP